MKGVTIVLVIIFVANGANGDLIAELMTQLGDKLNERMTEIENKLDIIEKSLQGIEGVVEEIIIHHNFRKTTTTLNDEDQMTRTTTPTDTTQSSSLPSSSTTTTTTRTLKPNDCQERAAIIVDTQVSPSVSPGIVSGTDSTLMVSIEEETTTTMATTTRVTTTRKPLPKLTEEGCPPKEMNLVCNCSLSLSGNIYFQCSQQYYEDIKQSFHEWDDRLLSSLSRSLFSFYANPILFKSYPHHIESDFFSGFSFKEVYIFKSGLSSFDGDVFNEVELLSLSYNNLTSASFPVDFLKPKTRRLYLDYNQLTEVPLIHSDLEVVDLSYNNIREVGSIGFRGEYIDFGNNRINFIKKNAFQPENSVTIYVHENSLGDDSLESGFISLKGLKNESSILVSLHRNAFTSISEVVFLPLLRANIYLDFTPNPLKCDCQMKWIFDLNSKCIPGINLNTKLFATCVGFKNFFSYQEEDFGKCKNPPFSCVYFWTAN